MYGQYLAGTVPLMAAHDAHVLAVGAGVTEAGVTQTWPINGILGFKSLESCQSFFRDPDYISIRQRYRDPAYEVLNLALYRALNGGDLESFSLMGDRRLGIELSHNPITDLPHTTDWLGAGIDASFAPVQWPYLRVFDADESQPLSLSQNQRHHAYYRFNTRPPRNTSTAERTQS